MSDQMDVLIQVKTQVDGLNERMDRHETKNDHRFSGVFKKLDEISERIHQVALDGVKEDGRIKENVATVTGKLMAKIAALAAVVSLMTGGLTKAVERMFYGPQYRSHSRQLDAATAPRATVDLIK